MYQSADYTKSYSVGDTYDPTNKTKGIKDKNVIITGAGTSALTLRNAARQRELRSRRWESPTARICSPGTR